HHADRRQDRSVRLRGAVQRAARAMSLAMPYPMNHSGARGEPGIHTPGLGLWIPGSRPSAELRNDAGRFGVICGFLTALLLVFASMRPASAEVGEIRLSKQYGLPYLPFMVM